MTKSSSILVPTTTTSFQQEESIEYTTIKPLTEEAIDVVSIPSKHSSKEGIISKNDNDLIGSAEITSGSESDDLYDNIEEVLENAATTYLPTTAVDESTEPFSDNVPPTTVNESGEKTEPTTSMPQTSGALSALNSKNHLVHDEGKQREQTQATQTDEAGNLFPNDDDSHYIQPNFPVTAKAPRDL